MAATNIMVTLTTDPTLKSPLCLRDRVLVFSPVLLAMVLMLPRLLSSQFGLLDDGVTLYVAQQIKAGKLIQVLQGFATSGRFVPAYWLFNSLVVWTGNSSPLWCFVVNALLLMGITGGLIGLVWHWTRSRLQAFVSGLLFVLSGPVIESFYTLSKNEPQQAVWLLGSLLLLGAYRSTDRRWKQLLVITVTSGFLLLAMATKQTAVVLGPIAFAWVVAGWIWHRVAARPVNLGARGVYLIACGMATVAVFALRSFFTSQSLTAGTYYQGYDPTWNRLLLSASRWGSWLIRDFPYLIPLLLFLVAAAFCGRYFLTPLMIDAGVWLIGWMGIFLPWQSTLEYYLLPFALGVAVFSGVVIGQVVSTLVQSPNRPLKTCAALCLACCLWAGQFTICNNVTNARLQLATDDANTSLINFLATLPPRSTVLVNLPEPYEYVYEIASHLSQIKQRPDLSVGYFRFQLASPSEKGLSYYVATPVMENQLLPCVRINVDEPGARNFNESLLGFLGRHPELVFQTIRRVRMLDFGLHRLVCVFGEEGINCSTPRPLVDTREFVYGWKVYRYSSEVRSRALPGGFLPNGTWELQTPNGTLQRIEFGQPGDVPLVGDWDGDGFTEIGVFRPSDQTWHLDMDMNGKPDVDFQFVGMQAGDVPLVGDWDGNGTATPGYFRPQNASWHFRNSNSTGAEDWPVLHLGSTADIPLTGDWDGDGRDTPAIYRPDSGEVELVNDFRAASPVRGVRGLRKARPVVGQWNGTGFYSIAFVVRGGWTLQPVNGACEPANNPASFQFGSEQAVPLAGRWRPQP